MIEPRLDELQDRESIRELMFRYGRGVDTVDYQTVISVFDDPCSLVIEPLGSAPIAFETRTAVEDFYRSRQISNSTSRLLRHRYKNPIIELAGDIAEASVYWDEYREVDNTLKMAGGIYLDILRRAPGGWRFRSRTIRMQFSLRLIDDVDEALAAGRLSLR